MRRISLPALALAVAALLAGCGSSHSSSSAPATARTIVISGYAYHPADLTVPPCTRITFVNRDQTSHTASATSGAFDAGTINPGQHKTVVLSKGGAYPYDCQFHAFMHGVITAT